MLTSLYFSSVVLALTMSFPPSIQLLLPQLPANHNIKIHFTYTYLGLGFDSPARNQMNI